MRTCPNCGESNGKNNETCFKCGEKLLQPPLEYKKICPKCRDIYNARVQVCPNCDVRLSVYTGSESFERPQSIPNRRPPAVSYTWLYVLCFLLPVVGLVLGIVYISRREEEIGKKALYLSLAAAVVWGVISFALYSCAMNKVYEAAQAAVSSAYRYR